MSLRVPIGLLVSSANTVNPSHTKPMAASIARDASVGHYDFAKADALIARMKLAVKVSDEFDGIIVSLIAGVRENAKALAAFLSR